MDILYKLLTPLNYLRIKHPQKQLVDIVLPLVFSLLICIAFYFLPKPIGLLGQNGLILSLSGFLQVLAGFFIAALGAIATFPNKDMDRPTDGIPLKLDELELTRRQFLSYMFGFLAFTGFILVLLSKMVLSAESNIIHLLSNVNDQYRLWLKLVFSFLYFTIFNSLLFTTLFGLHYLTEKIHEGKPEFTSSLGDAENNEEEPDDFT
ncbi:MAG: hypothetical protein V7785_13120 [Bermanella sp.]